MRRIFNPHMARHRVGFSPSELGIMAGPRVSEPLFSDTTRWIMWGTAALSLMYAMAVVLTVIIT